MSEHSRNPFLNNIIFVILIALLIAGAWKNDSELFSPNRYILNGTQKEKLPETNVNEKIYPETNIFDRVQGEHVRQKIDFGTAMEYFNSRQLSGTEIIELGKRSTTADYFVRNSNKKLIFYPTTGSNPDIQSFMREFTRLRTSLKNKSNLIFIPVETGFGISEKQIKNTSDRVFYNLKKECGKFCVIDAPAQNITSLKSPQIGAKTFEIVEALINSL